MQDDTRSPEPDALTRLSVADFVAGWRAIVGEPPAVVLQCRSEMIRILVASTPVALDGLDRPARPITEHINAS